MTKPTILVAGATGTNGRELIRELQNRDVQIRALVTDRERAKAVIGDNVELVHGNLADKESLKAAFEGVDKAYIVTAILPNTVDLFGNYFEAAIDADVAHLVKFSGLGSSPNSASEVIRQHAASDEVLIESGLTYTILRPNSFHQNMLWQAEAIAAGDTFYLPLGDGRQSTIDVRDIAEITAKILTSASHENKVYELTGPESLDFHEVATIIGDVRGKPVTYVPVTVAAAEAAMKEQGMPEWSAKVLAEIQGVFSTGAYAAVLPDAERLLGRKPRTFREFVEDNVKLFRSAA